MTNNIRSFIVDDSGLPKHPDRVPERVALFNRDGSAFAGYDGYEFTAGFTDSGGFVSYTQAMVDADQWLRFGFDRSSQTANDVAYWSDPDPTSDHNFDQSKGMFGGIHMPYGFKNLLDYDFNESPGFSSGVSGEALNYTPATGSYDFSDGAPGNFALIRFDFNIRPQIANTSVEVGIIFETRDASGNPTAIFPLTTTPIFYGTGSVAETYLNRPLLTAYFASNEDVRARALPAIKADNPIEVQPLTTLVTIAR